MILHWLSFSESMMSYFICYTRHDLRFDSLIEGIAASADDPGMIGPDGDFLFPVTNEELQYALDAAFAGRVEDSYNRVGEAYTTDADRRYFDGVEAGEFDDWECTDPHCQCRGSARYDYCGNPDCTLCDQYEDQDPDVYDDFPMYLEYDDCRYDR